MDSEKVRVGIAGLGRSGYSIHRYTLGHCSEFQVVAVADTNAERAAAVAAEDGIPGYTSVDELLADDNVELVVVATPNLHHSRHTVQALRAGKHVVCEKPFGITVAQVDEMLAARGDRVLAPFQNRRFETAFRTIRDVVGSGVLGEIVHIRTAWHGFGRRWDWQTLSSFEGGQINNNLPHPVDQMLTLLEDLGLESVEALDVFADTRNCLSSGDREDHVRVTLRAPKLPTVDIEFTAVCPFAQENYLIMATAGGLRATPNKVEWKWVDWSAMPPCPPPDPNSTPDRSYNREDLVWQTESVECDGSMLVAQRRFYGEVYAAIRDDALLSVTPEAVRKRIRVLEKVREAAR